MRFTRFLLWFIIAAVLYYGYQHRETIVDQASSLTHGSKDSAEKIIDRHQAEELKKEQETTEVGKSSPLAADVAIKAEEKKPVTATTTNPAESSENTSNTAPQGSEQKKSTSQPKAESQEDKQKELTWLHNRARQAVADKDFPVAIQAYQDLLNKQPNQAVLWGELGDLYHMTGDKIKASKSYGNAMLLFKKEGNNVMAEKLISYINNNAPEVAKRLQNY